jgi:hypothetical protein
VVASYVRCCLCLWIAYYFSNVFLVHFLWCLVLIWDCF